MDFAAVGISAVIGISALVFATVQVAQATVESSGVGKPQYVGIEIGLDAGCEMPKELKKLMKMIPSLYAGRKYESAEKKELLWDQWKSMKAFQENYSDTIVKCKWGDAIKAWKAGAARALKGYTPENSKSAFNAEDEELVCDSSEIINDRDDVIILMSRYLNTDPTSPEAANNLEYLKEKLETLISTKQGCFRKEGRPNFLENERKRLRDCMKVDKELKPRGSDGLRKLRRKLDELKQIAKTNCGSARQDIITQTIKDLEQRIKDKQCSIEHIESLRLGELDGIDAALDKFRELDRLWGACDSHSEVIDGIIEDIMTKHPTIMSLPDLYP